LGKRQMTTGIRSALTGKMMLPKVPGFAADRTTLFKATLPGLACAGRANIDPSRK
jgi:hypothetical protein